MKTKLRFILYKMGYKDSVLQKLWILIHIPYKALKRKFTEKKLQKKGMNVLNEIYDAANECSIMVWPEFGTLLGAYRNKSFISFDLDIDLGILNSDYTTDFEKALICRGFTKTRTFFKVDANTNKNTICELTFKYEGIHCDLFLSEIDGNNRLIYVCPSKVNELNQKFNVRQYKVKYSTKVENVMINKMNLTYPGNVYEYLKSIYGDNFMTPIKNWQVPNDNPIMKMLDSSEVYALEK